MTTRTFAALAALFCGIPALGMAQTPIFGQTEERNYVGTPASISADGPRLALIRTDSSIDVIELRSKQTSPH
jgi:hypothetical protein